MFFPASYLAFWGTVLCVLLMSSSCLFYIIMAQWLFGKTLRLVPLSGYVPGLDLLKFLLLPLVVGIVYQLGAEARLFRAMLLDLLDKIETNQNYTKSDTLQVMRILKNYDLLKDTQMDLLADRAVGRRPKA